VPESPRWQITHGCESEAECTVRAIEERVRAEEGRGLSEPDQAHRITLHPRAHFGFAIIVRAMFGLYWRRSLLGLALMVSQAFLYNAIFFTYALVLTTFYAVPSADTGLYLLPFAAGNFVGVLMLGHYFDTVGRRQMIAATYLASALLLMLTGYLFVQEWLSATTLTLMWTAIFFFASPAASAAYLTVSEIFPLETRALAIAVFYSVGTGIGGVAAPWLFGSLIATGSRLNVSYGYLFAAGLMIAAALVALVYGIAAERRPLEHVAQPLSSAE
ncbi:MAG TPA: MFS transporter, partial [Xanthobacteraceae bacterium]|nr:MFS transporter [Xanthobacteraceae bacterium]